MCFSAGASFGASAILAVAGVASLKKVHTRTQIPFAAIPLIFSIQQFCEGFVWIALKNNADWQQTPIILFLLFAQVVWPFWVPFSIFLLETSKWRKILLAVLLFMGTLLSLYLSYCFLSYHFSAHIQTYHIRYELSFPHEFVPFLALFYFLPTIVSPFVSSVRKMSFVGTSILVSFLITKLFFDDYVISVWCFFAALVSVVVFLVMKDMELKRKLREILMV
ncbi:MAG: hypothetical protein K0S53_624 [Bacteroidetes bacterium]|jgi:hypothetical protein|nr:hypothetical protein [Bacteroidota bacterium]